MLVYVPSHPCRDWGQLKLCPLGGSSESLSTSTHHSTLSIIICPCLLARKPLHCSPVDQDSPSVPSVTASPVAPEGVAKKPPMKKMMSIGTNHLKMEETIGRLSFQKSYNLVLATQTGPSPSPEGKPLKSHLKTLLCSAVCPPARKSYLEAFSPLSPCGTLYVCQPFKLFCKRPCLNKLELFALCLESGELLHQQVVQLNMSRCVE